jgi:hypothetical protein
MKTLFFVAIAVFMFSAEREHDKDNVEAERDFVGSTPGGNVIKNLLSIPGQTNVDFIRWHLHLSDEHMFTLKINFGVGKPNTPGFENGGATKSYEGAYSVVVRNSQSFIKLVSPDLPSTLEIMKMSQNILHLVGSNHDLLVGNGGWSYVLNNSNPVAESRVAISTNTKTSANPVSIFVGRTPCQELAVKYRLPVSDECVKLKFKITFTRDPATLNPLRYTMRRVIDNVPGEVSGSWSINRGISGNPNAIIYTLKSDQTKKDISLLVVNDDILYFLQPEDTPFVGNENFSYALNRSAN